MPVLMKRLGRGPLVGREVRQEGGLAGAPGGVKKNDMPRGENLGVGGNPMFPTALAGRGGCSNEWCPERGNKLGGGGGKIPG